MATPWSRRALPVPTGRLAVVVLVVGALVAVVPGGGWPLLVLVDGLLVVVALADVLAAPHPGRVAVRRRLPAAAVLGAEVAVTWEVANPTGRRVRVALADELAPSLCPEPRTVVVSVPAHGRAEASTRLRPTRRGRFVVEELAVRVQGPLGLMARQARRQHAEELRVLPAFGSRAEAELRVDRARLLEVGLRSAAGRGGGTDFEQLRDYSVDDEFRRVDWSATARSGRPIVRTYRAERNQQVLLLVDNGRVMAGRVADVPRFEHNVDAALALTAVATRLGDRTGLVAFDRRVRAVVAPGAGREQLARITDALFELEPVLAESDYRAAFTEAVARFRRRALLVVLTELSEASVHHTLLPALPVITGRHRVLVAGVRDPQLARWATTSPDDAAGAYRAAAAAKALAERRRTVARLQAAGAVVVDAAPGRLAGALTDAYLAVKAAGSL